MHGNCVVFMYLLSLSISREIIIIVTMIERFIIMIGTVFGDYDVDNEGSSKII